MLPKLYILMRSDMDSLNPGKAIAQGGHACTKFMSDMSERFSPFLDTKNRKKMDTAIDADPILYGYREWVGDRGFGTKITLDVGTEAYLKDTINHAKNEGYMADVILDQTYPLVDGDTTHYLPIITCGYIFNHDGVNHLSQGFSLYK